VLSCRSCWPSLWLASNQVCAPLPNLPHSWARVAQLSSLLCRGIALCALAGKCSTLLHARVVISRPVAPDNTLLSAACFLLLPVAGSLQAR
jgi:hypothetical protein